MLAGLVLLCLVAACSTESGADLPVASGEDDHAQSCLLQHTQRAPAERVKASKENDAQQSSASQGKALSWYVLGLMDYTTSVVDWFSDNDVYAWVKVQPHGLQYRSQVMRDKSKGTLDFHVYVSSDTESVEITLYDKGSWSNTKIGSATLKLGPNQQWCDLSVVASSGCSFSEKLNAKGKKTGSIDGYLAAGTFRDEKVAKLSMRGIAVEYQDSTRTGSKFKQFRIKNDEVENELAYAKTGSEYPESLHGIFWMDQRGTNVPIPGYPEYKQVCPVAADEILVSFGQGSWDAKKRCVTGMSVYGSGPFKGQWTWLDDTGSGSSVWEGENASNAVYDFCFADAKMQEIDIWTQTSVNSLLNDIFGYVPFKNDKTFAPPAFITNVRMIKTAWGWDRLTTVGPDFLRDLVRSTMGGILGTAGFVGGGLECHYPLFQIVDGDGKRTKYYDAYLQYANNQTNCKTTAFDCAPNVGKGTQMTGRLVGP